ncbi:hypothetical protein CFHF_23685 [Caulobacter flavus]|uniref:M23ase beta-sheet core domain-containing protein n=1 Tax=Caulobacter flavus TaxID=1679497 RepID=A0A2N5CLZ0_9CAUL|nr:M23 family metallopeptidase [Caulobacter flavus]AYV48160.1 hypothetical protein C1707_18870 [Caulobacter flavus]PLR06916.1 hypothetical protein CFHF_23685 [Caulobacter flavus]
MVRAGAWSLVLGVAAIVVVAGAALARTRTPATAAAPPSDLAAFVAAVERDAALPGQAAAPAPARTVVDGPMEEVLYGERAKDPTVSRALALLGHRLDLTRDVALGDRVRLVVGEDGRLDFVELSGSRTTVSLYRLDTGRDGRDRFVDADGADLSGSLLRTPLHRTRITSAFGPRRHPLLGYTRMHKGVDFDAPIGTPVLAAADGVVETADWAGGYGRRIRLRHADGLQTVYAHLSRWTVAAGQTVRQGEVVGLSGASGLATGPHLHFEVLREARAVDPSEARPAPAGLSDSERAILAARKLSVAQALAPAGSGG